MSGKGCDILIYNTSRYFIYLYYFLIPSSIENNLFIHHSFSAGVKSKTQVLVVVESRSILYSSNIVYLQLDWFTRYDGIMIED